jgi:tetratricopeptide (TPR) repeat protein
MKISAIYRAKLLIPVLFLVLLNLTNPVSALEFLSEQQFKEKSWKHRPLEDICEKYFNATMKREERKLLQVIIAKQIFEEKDFLQRLKQGKFEHYHEKLGRVVDIKGDSIEFKEADANESVILIADYDYVPFVNSIINSASDSVNTRNIKKYIVKIQALGKRIYKIAAVAPALVPSKLGMNQSATDISLISLNWEPSDMQNIKPTPVISGYALYFRDSSGNIHPYEPIYSTTCSVEKPDNSGEYYYTVLYKLDENGLVVESLHSNAVPYDPPEDYYSLIASGKASFDKKQYQEALSFFTRAKDEFAYSDTSKIEAGDFFISLTQYYMGQKDTEKLLEIAYTILTNKNTYVEKKYFNSLANKVWDSIIKLLADKQLWREGEQILNINNGFIKMGGYLNDTNNGYLQELKVFFIICDNGIRLQKTTRYAEARKKYQEAINYAQDRLPQSIKVKHIAKSLLSTLSDSDGHLDNGVLEKYKTIVDNCKNHKYEQAMSMTLDSNFISSIKKLGVPQRSYAKALTRFFGFIRKGDEYRQNNIQELKKALSSYESANSIALSLPEEIKVSSFAEQKMAANWKKRVDLCNEQLKSIISQIKTSQSSTGLTKAEQRFEELFDILSSHLENEKKVDNIKFFFSNYKNTFYNDAKNDLLQIGIRQNDPVFRLLGEE